LKERFPLIKGPAAQDICYATENRQLAVKAVAPKCDMVLVVGSQNSSNSRRLVEVCRQADVPAYLVDDQAALNPEWLSDVRTIGVTAGASAPEHLVQELLGYLASNHNFHDVEEVEIKEEDVRFSLPSSLDATNVQLKSIAGVRT
jgi:4-hydroxy-3-methylbut-2-enyl diphosphate reductase